jgi:nicotinamidase-related amidase
VLSVFRKKRHPVFHILRVHRRDGSDVEITRQELFRKHPFAVEGTHGAAVIEELTDLVITGLQTPNCIRTTVFDAIAYNYPVILVKDTVGAQSDDIHEANVRDMANIGVKIMNTLALAPVLAE